MKIILASFNPAKLEACRRATTRLFPGSIVTSIESLKDLPAQPLGLEETKSSALKRARHAAAAAATNDDDYNNTQGSYGIGLEGGVSFDGWLINCAAVVCSKTGRESFVYGLSFPLPPQAIERIVKNKEEMGPVMDEIFAKQGSSKSVGGAIGQLTNGVLSRAEMWESPLLTAFIPFLHPNLYYISLSSKL